MKRFILGLRDFVLGLVIKIRDFVLGLALGLTEILLGLAEIFTSLLIGVMFLFFTGAIFMYLWKWIIVPFGLPPINLFHATGIIIIKNFLTFKSKSKEKNRVQSLVVAEYLINLLFFLGVGYLLSLYI